MRLYEKTFDDWKTEDWQMLWKKWQETRLAEDQTRAEQARAQRKERMQNALEEGDMDTARKEDGMSGWINENNPDNPKVL